MIHSGLSGRQRFFADQISRARAIDLADIAAGRGLELKRRGRELVGPCPVCCDGHDRFAINEGKRLWNCRSLSERWRRHRSCEGHLWHRIR